jgi:cobalamin biosynthesis protein CobW
MIDAAKLPTTIVTGFLGSGKTTLLRHLITRADGRRLAVIVNEFGEVGVDGELLRQCSVGCEETTAAGPLYELANGCLCCTVQEEFVPVLQALMERRERVDHILIETSGLALPKPLVQAFQWPEIRAACTVDAVIALIDGPAVLAGQFAADPDAVERERREDPSVDHVRSLRELFEDQLVAADLVIVNKADGLDADGLAQLRRRIGAHTSPEVKVVTAVRGELPPQVVLGLGRAAERAIDSRHTHHDEDHAAGRPHSHELFDTVVLRLAPLARPALLRGLERVAREHEVYRAKGFAAVEGKDMRLVVQGVGARLESYFDRPWAPHEARRTQLVLIGANLDRERLAQTLLAGAAA